MAIDSASLIPTATQANSGIVRADRTLSLEAQRPPYLILTPCSVLLEAPRRWETKAVGIALSCCRIFHEEARPAGSAARAKGYGSHMFYHLQRGRRNHFVIILTDDALTNRILSSPSQLSPLGFGPGRCRNIATQLQHCLFASEVEPTPVYPGAGS